MRALFEARSSLIHPAHLTAEWRSFTQHRMALLAVIFADEKRATKSADLSVQATAGRARYGH